MQTITPPKGFHDFHPEVMQRRGYLEQIIKKQFAQAGFLPLATPAMERLSTLMGKYGAEGDQLLFKVLKSGPLAPHLANVSQVNNPLQAMQVLSQQGLRYDLTVPLARYVVQHRHRINLPFKRYQIAPVWRADRPQRGRFREFWQCDVDILGSSSLFMEAELLGMIQRTLGELKVEGGEIILNHRLIIEAIAEQLGGLKQVNQIAMALDKLEKKGVEAVQQELIQIGFSQNLIKKKLAWLWSWKEGGLTILQHHLGESPLAKKALEELGAIMDMVRGMKVDSVPIRLTPTLARGMAYYTGAIFEVIVKEGGVGSIGGGGRYANLTALFGKERIDGVGFSFGFERLYAILEKQNLFPEKIERVTKLLFVPLSEEELGIGIDYLTRFRKAGVATELYPPDKKIKRAMQYANKKEIPYVALLGEEEVQNQMITLKNLSSRTQELIKINEAIKRLTE